ncbi:Nif3-like dinuclear metal center hexameric protein [Actinotalea sp.]|uniref:Nif3-like dinuclear metal center hexameric protein n=1 Tax=Actinotalea sp. TaxID=1872145 RepID=UPI003569CB85
MTSPTLADVVAVLDTWYPPSTAEDWDAPGTVCGDPTAPVRKVLLAVDVTAAVVDEALDWGADLLVAHHPLYLRPVHSVAGTTYKGALVHRLIRGGCALHAAHTNADAAAGGVADALATAIGLVDLVPLVPIDPTTGTGRIGRLPEPLTLEQFARQVAAAVPPTEHGVRVAGARDGRVRTVAVVGGSGDSLFDDVRAAGVDAYVTADLRHHPASELRERAAFEAGSSDDSVGTPYLVDVAHSASEWLWLPAAAQALETEMAERFGGTRLDTRVSTLRTDPWTFRLDSPPRPASVPATPATDPSGGRP